MSRIVLKDLLGLGGGSALSECSCYYVHPLGGGHIIFAFSAVRRPTWFPDILGNLCNFQKIFPSPKMAAILNFRIFAKNGKTQICFYLLNRAR